MTAITLTRTQADEIDNRLDNYKAEGMAPFGILHGHRILEILDLDDAIDEAGDILKVARDCERDARNSHVDGGREEARAVRQCAALVRKLEARRGG